MRVVRTKAALDDLEAIADDVAARDPMAAARLVDDIPARTNALLAGNPESGRPGRVGGTRELILTGTPSIVAYRLGRHVDVLAVVHGARQWPRDFR